MANILVYIERSGGRPSGASLQALGAGRRVASFLGATLHAVLPCATPRGDPEAVAVLGRHGADKVLVAASVDPDLPSLDATHGALLAAALVRVPSALLLLPATPGGRDLAPRAAARLGAAYVPEPDLECAAPGELVLSRPVFGGGYRRRLALHELERPLVVTVTPGTVRPARGAAIADVIHLRTEAAAVAVVELDRTPDPAAALETAAVVVTAGAGVTAEGYALVKALAAALGGEVGVTRAAVEQGLDSSEREVGLGGRRVAPRLYLACGASGSAEHLGAISPGARIVAINRDADAPIFRAATYGIIGDVAEIAAALIAAVSHEGARG